MKRFLILLSVFGFLMSSQAFAKRQIPSPIPPANSEFIDIEAGVCDENCLQNLLDKRLEFSFLARFNFEYGEKFRGVYTRLSGVVGDLNLPQNLANSEKIAVLIPQNIIGGYANIVANSIYSYIFANDLKTDIKFYLSGNESEPSLRLALSRIEADSIKLVVAPLTETGAKFVAQNSSRDTLFFIPTLHFKMVGESKGNIFFGGIDYEDQIKKLLEISSSNIIIFSDKSPLSNSLNSLIIANGGEVRDIVELSENRKSLLGVIDERFDGATLFLNLPLDKSIMVLNELENAQFKPEFILTTQINFAPRLLPTSTKKEMKNLIVANSISRVPANINATSLVMDLDMSYNWVAYSSAIGLDYLYSLIIDKDHAREFDESIFGSSILYETKLFVPKKSGFSEYKPSDYAFSEDSFLGNKPSLHP